LGSLVIALCHPDGVPERVMREALDWLVDRLASGWATHAVLLADAGKQQTSPLMALGPEYAQSQPHGCCSARKPYQASRQ
jgi:hypothetical protein